MKRIGIALIIFCSASRVHSQDSIDILHYRFEINLSDKHDTVKGRAFVTIKFLQGSARIWLNLSSRKNGTGMVVYQVREDGRPTTFKHYNDTVLIQPAAAVKADEVRTFELVYAGVPSDGLIISKNKYSDRTYFSDNWPNRAHNWIPCKDRPDDKATFEFIVTAPSKFRVVSNGKLLQERVLDADNKLTHWKEDIPLSTKVMVIGVARFAVKEYPDSPENIPVSAWVYPQDSARGFRNYSVAPAIVKFYSDYIGTYPYNKLANVQSKTIFGGMENASAIFYFERSAEIDGSIEDLMAHEIAHQWFGDMATEKRFSHVWLSEGFATYLTDIFLEWKYGKDSMSNRLSEERRKVIDFLQDSHPPVVDSVSPPMELLSPNSYEKGAWILHMLRSQMGDSVFHRFIRTYYDTYKGKNADTEDLQNIAEQTSGKNLGQFFKQWLYTSGIPRLKIQWHYDKTDKTISIQVVQQQQTPFQFPLEIKLEAAGKSMIKTLTISKQSESFALPVDTVINKIRVDPNTSLLFEEVK